MSSRRLLAALVVALTLVGGAACARQDPVPSQTTSTTAAPVAPLPSLSSTLATQSPQPSPAALDPDQLIRAIDDCAKGGCAVKAHLALRKSAKPMEFVLARMPGEPDAVELQLRMALFDSGSQRLTWQSPLLYGVPGGEGGTPAKADSTGHVAVTLGRGAHASILYVLNPADGVHVTFFGPPDLPDGRVNGYSTTTPNARAEDVDGDGVFELIVPVNDYIPDYAYGGVVEYRYTWNGSDYVVGQCEVFPAGSSKGAVYPGSHAKCKTG